MVVLQRLGVNHFRSMPSLPGTGQPLTITGSSGAKAKARGGGKGSRKGKSNGNQEGSPPKKRVRGDDELLQLDLKRKAHVLQTNVVTRLHFVQVHSH